MRKYTISYLLSRQPKSIKKNPYYSALINYYNSSPELKKAAFNRICFRVLNRAKVLPKNLNTFYKIYNLPKNPFFPLFFKIKSDYLYSRLDYKKRRENYIINKWNNLRYNILCFLKKLKNIEKSYNIEGRCPFWDKHMFPDTKKKVNQYYSFTLIDWADYFQNYLNRLTLYYKISGKKNGKRIIACFLLDVPENNISIQFINKQYYKLSKMYHPDKGGKPKEFRVIKRARDFLLKELQ